MRKCFLLLTLTMFLGFSGCGKQEPAQTAAQGESDLANDAGVTEPAKEEPTSQGKQDARAVLLAATVKAKVEDKRVLVHLGAPW